MKNIYTTSQQNHLISGLRYVNHFNKVTVTTCGGEIYFGCVFGFSSFSSPLMRNMIDKNNKAKFVRFYASGSKGQKDYSLISNTLRKLDSSLAVNGFVVNESSQRFIESFVYNEFESNTTKRPNYIASIDTNILGSTVSNYINSKLDMLNTYIDSLFEVSKQNAEKKTKSNNINASFTYEVLNKVGKQFVLSICIHHFLIILTHQDTQHEEYNYTNLLGISISIGKKLVQKYLFEINTVNKGEIKPSYSSFLTS